MDVATHLFIPYAAALAAFGFWRRGGQDDGRKASVAAVVGVSGFAPDLDGLLDGVAEAFPVLYALQHRGASHSLLFAPVLAFALVALLGLAARRWPRRFGLFTWRASLAPWVVLGAWSHLLLDSVTLAGIPLWWPFADGRVAFMLFHWLVIWLLPPLLIVLGLHAWGRVSRRGVVLVGAMAVATLLVLGGIRLAERPDIEGAMVFPRDSAKEWLVLEAHDNGSYHASLLRGGAFHEPMWFVPRAPLGAERAIEQARDTSGFRGFLMGSYGPRIVEAEARDAGWTIRFTDVAQRYEALHDPRWTPTTPFDAWGYVEFEVTDDEVRLTHRGW